MQPYLAVTTSQVNPAASVKTKDYFDERTVNNHVRLMSFWQLNPKRLNEKLASFVEELVSSELEHNLHDMDNLQILYAVATADLPKNRPDLLSMKHVASGVTVEFMKSLYITEDGDHKVS